MRLFGLGGLLLGCSLSLMGCVSQPVGGGVSERVQVSFSAAQNDLFPKLEAGPRSIYTVPLNPDTERVVLGPMSYAVACNAAHTSCKHAVVLSRLFYSSEAVGGGKVHVWGRLSASMDRSQSVDAPNFSHSQSIPDSVDVIAVTSENVPFDAVIGAGEVLKLQGLAGSVVTVKVVREQF